MTDKTPANADECFAKAVSLKSRAGWEAEPGKGRMIREAEHWQEQGVLSRLTTHKPQAWAGW